MKNKYIFLLIFAFSLYAKYVSFGMTVIQQNSYTVSQYQNIVDLPLAGMFCFNPIDRTISNFGIMKGIELIEKDGSYVVEKDYTGTIYLQYYYETDNIEVGPLLNHWNGKKLYSAPIYYFKNGILLKDYRNSYGLCSYGSSVMNKSIENNNEPFEIKSALMISWDSTLDSNNCEASHNFASKYSTALCYSIPCGFELCGIVCNEKNILQYIKNTIKNSTFSLIFIQLHGSNDLNHNYKVLGDKNYLHVKKIAEAINQGIKENVYGECRVFLMDFGCYGGNRIASYVDKSAPYMQWSATGNSDVSLSIQNQSAGELWGMEYGIACRSYTKIVTDKGLEKSYSEMWDDIKQQVSVVISNKTIIYNPQKTVYNFDESKLFME